MSLEAVQQSQHDVSKRQHIILTKGQINNSGVAQQSNMLGQQMGKKGQVQQARVQSGHPIIKASKVTKRGQLQMVTQQGVSVGNNQQATGQKMNIK